MKYIRDDELKAAFVTMINKLVFGRRLILKPYFETVSYTHLDVYKRQVRDGQPLGNRSSAEDDFTAIEDDDDFLS